MIGILHMLVNDIEKKGLKKLSKPGKGKRNEYTDGLMHLVFKKKNSER